MKLLAACLGAMAALAFAELGLRVAGYLSYAVSGRGGFESTDSGLRILCHGDSNVFGIYEPAEESFPGQLELLLDARVAAGPHSVVNLGVPGLGSRQMLSVIEKDIERIEPDAVFVTIGANDAWRWSPEAGADYVEPPFWEELRLAKVLRLYAYRRGEGRLEGEAYASPHGDMEVESADEEGSAVWSIENREGERIRRYAGAAREDHVGGEDYWRLLRQDLVRLHELAGDRLVLACYGSDDNAYGKANAVYRSVARERGIPLVDAAAELEQLAARSRFSDVFWADLHPRGLGYEVIARACYDKLVELGIAAGKPFDDRLEGLRSRTRKEPLIELSGDPERGLSVEVAGEEPGRHFAVVFWDLHRGDEAPPERTYHEVLKDDPLYRVTFREESLRGRFDESGHGRIRLDSFLEGHEDFSGVRVRAGYIVYADEDYVVLARFSDPVVIEFP